MRHETGNKKYGYTLIEALIAATIFFILVAGPTGLFISSLRSQTRILGLREVIDNTSHTIEYMSRALRMAKKELSCSDRWSPDTCSCLTTSGYGYNYEITRSGTGIKFNNYKSPSICQEFFWDVNDNRIKEVRDGGTPVALTSDDLEVISFKISSGHPADPLGNYDRWGQDNDYNQPRVTLLLRMRTKAQKPEARSELKIQTTISQRNLDIVY